MRSMYQGTFFYSVILGGEKFGGGEFGLLGLTLIIFLKSF